MRRLLPNFTENTERNTGIFTEMMVGGMGFQVINDSDYHVGNFYKIIPLETDTRVTSATYFEGYSALGLSSVSLPIGVSIYGDFTSITLSAGSVIGYFMY